MKNYCLKFLEHFLLFSALLLVATAFSMKYSFDTRKSFKGESWDYVTVRPKAHMFYWLYETTHPSGYKERPLILWLQGGPGGSGTGFGNFQEIGPLDVNLNKRNTTWLQTASLLFIDNPVGTGYSYVEDKKALTTSVAEISADLLTLMQAFVKKHPDFEKIPFYIFSESYGGKMTAAFSKVLYDAIQAEKIALNFKGFAMGDSWISPVDSVNSWGPYLYATSIIDDDGLAAIQTIAKKVEKLVNEGKFVEATGAWDEAEGVVGRVSGNVNFYNIMNWGGEGITSQQEESQTLKFQPEIESHLGPLYRRHVKPLYGNSLDELMNGPIRKKLGIIPDNVQWGGQSKEVFEAQGTEFMKNVTSTVNDLINKTPLKVVVYQGQLDLICDTLGAEMWFDQLDVAESFESATRVLKSCKSHPVACYYQKEYKNVQFYWILGAGHMVPSDNGYGALDMVNQIIAS
ncbi:carboxypeptidase [Plakobranchus ocellatus]|uniref:Carboxypeptidase n=1 Tax=Plakobranchus ocellatus TaxID=259542 RepID=A0AAV4D1Q9_9GAST|nr:carboxypeptidase [Plakobranchus ocellatus]